MIDSHAHLYFDRFDEDREQVIERARAAGVAEIINIGIDLPTSERCAQMTRARDDFHAAVGLHPTTVVERLEENVETLRSLVTSGSTRIVAIGEVGLDYYWKDVAPEDQKPKLRAQLALARELELPVIFHCRDALEDLFEILDEEPPLPGGVFHCFGGDASQAERALGLGFHVSFAGNVTYPKAKTLQEAARAVPMDRLLLETDAPFLPPQPRRGKRNEPSFLPLTCEFLAELKGVSPEELDAVATDTTRTLFRL